jgi:hypothetical protein
MDGLLDGTICLDPVDGFDLIEGKRKQTPALSLFCQIFVKAARGGVRLRIRHRLAEAALGRLFDCISAWERRIILCW